MVQMKGWDVIVFDLRMQGLSGLDVLKKLRSSYPNLLVLILTMYPEDQLATRILRAGASGYLTKENAPDELVNAIKKVVAGERYVTLSKSLHLIWGLNIKNLHMNIFLIVNMR